MSMTMKKWFEFETREDLEKYIMHTYEQEKGCFISYSTDYIKIAKMSHIGELSYLSGEISKLHESAQASTSHMLRDWVNQGAKKIRIPIDVTNYMLEDIKYRGDYSGVPTEIPTFFRLYVKWEYLEGILKDFSKTISNIGIFDGLLNKSMQGFDLKKSFWRGLEKLRSELQIDNEDVCKENEFSAICSHVLDSKLAGCRFLRQDVKFKPFVKAMALYYDRKTPPTYRISVANNYIENKMSNLRRKKLMLIFSR